MTGVALHGALAVHPGALGDVLLAIPAVRALRVTTGSVAVAAQRHIAALLVALAEADAAHDFEGLRLDALFTDDGEPVLPVEERIVCWFGARDAAFTRRLRARAPDAVIAPSIGAGVVWEHLLRTVGAPVGEWRGVARVVAPLVAAGRAALLAAGWDGRRRFILVQPGAGGIHKRWPAEGFAAALADVGDAALVMHEGPADAAAVSALAARLPDALRLRAPALPTLAGALHLATMFVGNDSGVSHLAASVGAPSVILFLDSNLAWRPWAIEPEVLPVTVSRVVDSDVATVRAAIRRRLP
ncbi:MAG TPA: glycosyltransferase family 9 protein [Methylomirabilota bacterium]|nr:glycosyltransferase family 9 protein [Methylomirabilota bacterium]